MEQKKGALLRFMELIAFLTFLLGILSGCLISILVVAFVIGGYIEELNKNLERSK